MSKSKLTGRTLLELGLTLLLLLLLAACAKAKTGITPASNAYGTTIVLSSGDQQVAGVGMELEQPVIVQVNDAQGVGVAGAPVEFRSSPEVRFTPAAGLTDSSGQFSATVSLGNQAGRNQLTAATRDKSGGPIEVEIDEIALGYRQTVGQQLNRQYCDRCHNLESTPERVSNYDNLTAKPHPFTEGNTLNKLTNDELAAIITHGGPAIGRSAEMPPWGYTLSQQEIQALIAYLRAVSDPPYRTKGAVYAPTE